MNESETTAGEVKWTPKAGYMLDGEKSRTVRHAELSTIRREIEDAFASKVAAKHAVLVGSPSASALLAWLLPWESQNRRVVVPAVPCSAVSVMPAIQLGYEPVLCEIEPETWGLDPKSLRRICESEKGPPSVVLVSHILGARARINLEALKHEHGFFVIEDAAESRLGPQEWDVTIHSTPAGGFVCTDQEDLYNVLLMLRAGGCGQDLPPQARARMSEAAKAHPFLASHTAHIPGIEDLAVPDVSARATLADDHHEALARNHAAYFSRFASAKAFAVQKVADDAEIASTAFGVLASSSAHRGKIVERLREKMIETDPIGCGNIGRHPFWTNGYGVPKRERPIADRIHDCGFVLPNNPTLTVEDVGYIADAVLAVAP